ncbi:family 2 glycosyl transferase [Flammeovirgaceae bacterium 311]|nr:family 2 glycosyl transferase [Flammeovirgaceae bacterium 311]
MIPVYNAANFLPQTLAAVLLQDLGADQMQIEVVDDASTDANIEAMVHELGGGRISYYRQPVNVGSLRNFETCLNRSHGYLIHLLHADDLVQAGYYQKMDTLFECFPEAAAAFCRYTHIDERGNTILHQQPEASEDGILTNWLLRLGERLRIQCCTITVKREVYEALGGFWGVTYGEDWEMWMRIASRYPMAYTPETLAAYRMHFQSISGQAYNSAQNMRDLQWVINTTQEYLPQAARQQVRKKALKFYAHFALRLAHRLWNTSHNRKGALAQVREALRMHQDLSLYWQILKLYTKMLLNYP